MTKIIILAITLMTIHHSHAQESEYSKGKLKTSKAIFGEFTRDEQFDSHRFENRIVGHIGNFCTGTLVGPRHVLTAAHCLFEPRSDIKETNLQFSPGSTSKKSSPFGTINWKRVFYPKEFDVQNNNFLHDYAIIELDKNIGELLGWAAIKVVDHLEEYSLLMRGYPGDMPTGSQWLVMCPGMIWSDFILYKCDTFGGMSGSAIFNNTDPKNVKYINGIHLSANDTNNSGLKINRDNFEKIMSWIKGHPHKSTVIRKNSNK